MKISNMKRWFRWAPLLYVAVFALSVAPFPDMPSLDEVPLMDKWVHFVMYAGLAGAVWLDIVFARDFRGFRPRHFLYAVLCPALFGGLMELVQAYCTTYRSGEWLDVFADVIGVLLAIPCAYLLAWWKQKH